MTMHISPDELYALVFDNTAMTAAAADHLARCTPCRRQVDDLQELVTDLTIARLSQPANAALDCYRAMFVHIQQQPSPLRRFVDQIRAVLTWDSRQQPALQGLRSGAAATTYRQLYAAEDIEIELMIERVGRLRRLEGDLIADETGDENEPALVELLDKDGTAVQSVQTDDDGLFRLEGVVPGVYHVVMTRSRSAPIEIEALEIA